MLHHWIYAVSLKLLQSRTLFAHVSFRNQPIEVNLFDLFPFHYKMQHFLSFQILAQVIPAEVRPFHVYFWKNGLIFLLSERLKNEKSEINTKVENGFKTFHYSVLTANFFCLTRNIGDSGKKHNEMAPIADKNMTNHGMAAVVWFTINARSFPRDEDKAKVNKIAPRKL